MNSRIFTPTVLALILTVSLNAQNTTKKIPVDLSNPVEAELDLVRNARDLAEADDDAGVDQQLSMAPQAKLKLGQSVALARRTAALCGWLRNDNQYGRAMKVARRAIKQLARMSEVTDADRAERLYWEGWLQAEVLDDKPSALDLLRRAERLAPSDERVLSLELRLTRALAEFGH